MRHLVLATGIAALALGFRPAGAQRPGEMERPALTAADLEGPPVPDFVVSRFELAEDQTARYRQLYDSFMVATKPQRDSAQGGARAMREAFDARDRATAREHGPTLRRLGDHLAQRQKEFDAALKGFLNSDQWKEYKQWRDEQARQAAEERRHERERRFGGRRPGFPGP